MKWHAWDRRGVPGPCCGSNCGQIIGSIHKPLGLRKATLFSPLLSNNYLINRVKAPVHGVKGHRSSSAWKQVTPEKTQAWYLGWEQLLTGWTASRRLVRGTQTAWSLHHVPPCGLRPAEQGSSSALCSSGRVGQALTLARAGRGCGAAPWLPAWSPRPWVLRQALPPFAVGTEGRGASLRSPLSWALSPWKQGVKIFFMTHHKIISFVYHNKDFIRYFKKQG